LKNLIRETGSHSIVVPTPGKLVKTVLGCMGAMGVELMYKEQYMIADENYILDISETEKELEWEPQYADSNMIVEAYRNYLMTYKQGD